MPVIGLPLKIVHEDDNVLVLDKPPSLPVRKIALFLKASKSNNHTFFRFLGPFMW